MCSDDSDKTGTRHATGPDALMAAVIDWAVRTVVECLYSDRDGYGSAEQYEEAVVSWGWLCGCHAKRLQASIAYEVAGLDTREAVEVFRERFDRIDARLMRQIDFDARQCPLWVLPLPRGTHSPLRPARSNE
jgi:hypothetical protein